MTPELERLKAAAEATDGVKWEMEGFEQIVGRGTFYGGLIMHEDGETIIAQCVLPPWAQFIAAANPAVILTLIAQLEAAPALVSRQLEIAECAGVEQGLDAAMRAASGQAQTGGDHVQG